MQTWTEDQIRFMEDATRDGVYFSKLADLLTPHLKGCRTVMDAGCGLGQLAMELGKRGFQVTAADYSEPAVRYLEKKKPENVTPLLCDLLHYEGKKCDAAVFNYFGEMEDIVNLAQRLTTGPVLIVKRNSGKHRFSFSDQPFDGCTSMRAEDWLQKNHIPYREELFECELGQPFRSLEDALLFFSIYSKDKDRSLITEERVLSRLVETGDKDYPWYMPHRKSSMLLIPEGLV